MSSLLAEKKPAVPLTRPPAASRRAGSLNLSSRPFVNTRPVTRVSILLWVLGLLLLLGNVSLFWSYLSGSAEKRAELSRLEQEIQRQNQTATQLEQRLASLKLEQQNRKVRYLNRKIAERTFSWSLLFDRLAEVLPNDVRLTRLAPKPLGRQDDKQADREQESDQPQDGRVLLVINGRSKSDEALLDFVDRLFAHSSFEEPDLPREAREEGDDQVEFDVRVTYLPGGRPGEVAVVEEAAPPEILEVAPAPPAGPPATPGSGIDE